MTQLPVGLGSGASTRLANITANAAKAGMGGNLAAVNALNPATAGKHVAPKSQVDTNAPQAPPQQIPQQLPIQAPQTPSVQQPIHSAPSALQVPQQEDPIERYNRNQTLDHIISSPEMMDTVTKLKLRNHFKGRSDDGLGMEALDSLKTFRG